MDTTFKTEKGVFTYRVGAIVLNGTKVLLAHNKKHNQYYTVGGRAHFGESSEQAVLRELFEETGIKAKLDRLAVINENFFAIDGAAYHELAFFYLVRPFDFDKIDFSAIKCDGENEELCWVDLGSKEEIKDKLIYPVWFAEEVLRLPEEVRHIITVEDNFKRVLDR